MVLLQKNDTILATATWKMSGFLEVLVAEAMAVLKTIESINKFQYEKVMIHSDAKTLISTFESNMLPNNY